MTDLATRDQQALVVPQAQPKLQIEGFEDLDQSLVILPRWSITQPTSKFEDLKGHEGWFHRNIDGQYREHLEAVILSAQQERILWGDVGEKRPMCVSRDGGLTGSLPRNADGEFGACGTCAFNITYNRALAEERDRGLPVKVCGFGLRFLLVDDLTEGTMALYSALGTSVRPARTLVTQFANRRKSAFSAVVKLGTREERNDRGRYYVLDGRVDRWLEGGELAEYRERYQSMRGVQVQDIDEDDDTVTPSAPTAVNPTEDEDEIPF